MRTTYYHFIDSTVGIGITYHTLANGTVNEFGVGVSSHIGIGTFNEFAQFAIHHDGPASESNRTGGLEIVGNSNSSGDKHGARILAYNRVGRDPNDPSVKIKGFRRLRFQASEYQFETPSILESGELSTNNAGPTLNITGFGSVGIGSTDPKAKLDVFGNIKLSDSDPEIQLNFGGPRFRVPEDNTLTIHSGGDSGSESHETVRISQSGYIGVGTANPTAPLVVRNSNNTLGIFTSTDSGANIDLFDDDNQSRIRTVDGRLHIYADFNGGGSIGNVANSSIRFFIDGNNERFKIDGDGQVVYTPMTTAQRDALTGQTGGVIFNSSTSKLQVYDGSAWVDLH